MFLVFMVLFVFLLFVSSLKIFIRQIYVFDKPFYGFGLNFSFLFRLLFFHYLHCFRIIKLPVFINVVVQCFCH